jgi:hypothetical protein
MTAFGMVGLAAKSKRNHANMSKRKFSDAEKIEKLWAAVELAAMYLFMEEEGLAGASNPETRILRNELAKGLMEAFYAYYGTDAWKSQKKTKNKLELIAPQQAHHNNSHM